MLTSDHFPLVALFRTQGEGVSPDLAPRSPAITSVVHGASFQIGISSGSWVTIFGENLAPTTRIWRSAEIIGGLLPTDLDGVRVRIDHKPAAVFFISPEQLNVQVPDGIDSGEVMVEVIRDGWPIATAFVNVHDVAPGLFTLNLDNSVFAAAVHLDGQFVGEPSLFGNIPARPARPGNTVLLFGTGFGPTSPGVPAGEVLLRGRPPDP